MAKKFDYMKFINRKAVSEAITGSKEKMRPDRIKKYRPLFVQIHLAIQEVIDDYVESSND